MTSQGPGSSPSSQPAYSHYSVTIHYLQSIACFKPGAPAPAFQRLNEIITVLPSPFALAEIQNNLPSTPEQALSLITTVQGLLPLLEENEPANPLGGEMMSALFNVLADLAAESGAAVRRERSGLIRGLYVIIDPEVTGGREAPC